MKLEIDDIKVRGNRIWLPKEIQKKIKGNFFEVKIRKSKRNSNFITILTKDGRFVIPKNIREFLKLELNDIVNAQIMEIKNKKRKIAFFKNGRFDMLAFIPNKTMSNFKVLAKEEDPLIHLWYSTKGRPKEIKIMRFLPLEFARFTGYFQAEGGKPKLEKRRGRELSFTNKSPKLIEEFLRLSKYLFDCSLWNATIRYNIVLKISEIEKISKLLEENGVSKEFIKAKNAKRISSYTVKLWISNSLLAETVSNMTECLMRYLTNNKWDIIKKDSCIYFLQGLFAGDGNFYSWKDKKGSLHSRFQIYEGKKKYIEIYKKLLSRFGISGKIVKEKNKNLFIFRSYLNWNNLLTILDCGMFKYSEHEASLKKTIIEHKKFKAMKHLIKIKDKISVNFLGKITNRPNYYSSSWLRDRGKEGIIRKIGKRGNAYVWELTMNGKKIKGILNKL